MREKKESETIAVYVCVCAARRLERETAADSCCCGSPQSLPSQPVVLLKDILTLCSDSGRQPRAAAHPVLSVSLVRYCISVSPVSAGRSYRRLPVPPAAGQRCTLSLLSLCSHSPTSDCRPRQRPVGARASDIAIASSPGTVVCAKLRQDLSATRRIQLLVPLNRLFMFAAGELTTPSPAPPI